MIVDTKLGMIVLEPAEVEATAELRQDDPTTFLLGVGVLGLVTWLRPYFPEPPK